MTKAGTAPVSRTREIMIGGQETQGDDSGADPGPDSAEARSFAGASNSVDAILAMVLQHTGLRTAFLSRFDEDERIFTVVEALNRPGGCDLPTGLTYPETPSFCHFAMRAPTFIEDTRDDPRPDIRAASMALPGIGAYFGVPLQGADGRITGALCAIDPEPKTVAPGLPEYLALLGRLLATHLDWERERALHAQALCIVQTSEEHFRSLIEHGSEIITLIDGNWNRISSTSSRSRQLGNRDSARIGRFVLDAVHPDDAGLVRDALERVSAHSGVPVTYTCRVLDADGRWLWYECIARNALDNPAVNAIVVNARNVHERVLKERHDALVQRAFSEIDTGETFAEALGAALRAIGEDSAFAAGVGWWVDPVEGKLRASATWNDAPGIKPFVEAASRRQFMSGQDEAGRARELDAPRWFPDLRDAPAFPHRDDALNLGIRSAITIPLHGSGELRGVLQFYCLQVRTEEDEAFQRMIEAAAAVEDRLAAREARERVIRSEERYRALTENSGDLIIVLGEDECVTWANEPSGSSALAFHPGALLGRDAAQFVHHDDLESLRSMMRIAAADPARTFRLELRIRPLDGPWFWFETVMHSHVADPAIGGFVLTSREITDIKVDERVRVALAMVSTAAAESGLQGALQAIAEAGCFATGWPYGEVWSVDPDGQHLRLAASWHGDLPGASAFTDAASGIVCPRGEGIVGSVLERGAPQWRDTSVDDPEFIRQRLARDLGLGAAMAIPLEEDGEIRFVANFMRQGTYELDSLMVDLLWRFAGESGPILVHARANQALGKAEERFRAIFDGLSTPIIVHNARGELTYASQSITSIYGWTPEELAARGFDFPTRHPDDLPAMRIAFQHLLEHPDELVVFVARTLCRDGVWRWVESSTRNLQDVPSVQGMVGVIMDVTDRMQRDRASQIVEAAERVAGPGSNLAAMIRAAIGEAAHLSGFAYAEAWLARDDGRLHLAADWADPRYDASWIRETTADLTFGPGQGLPGHAWTEGRIAWIESFATDSGLIRQPTAMDAGLRSAITVPLRIGPALAGGLVFLDTREIAGASLTADVLERAFDGLAATFAIRQAQDTIVHNERRFRALTEGLSDVVIVVRGKGEISYASPSVETLLQHSPSSLTGHNLTDWIHPDDLPAAAACARSLREDPASEHRNLIRLCRADGAWRWVECFSHNHEHDPAIGGLVISMRDVTDQEVANRTARLVNHLAVLSQQDAYDPGSVCQAICQETGFAYGEIWELAPGGAALVQSGAWHQPGLDYERFAEITSALAFRPGEGLPGEVWRTGLPAVVGDAAADPRLVRAAAAGDAGLHAAIAAPLLLGGSFTGVLMLFDRAESNAGYDDYRLHVVTESLRQAEPFFAARAARLTLRRNEERFRALTEGMSDVILVRTSEAITYASPAIATLIGREPSEVIGGTLASFMHPDDAAVAPARFRASVSEGRTAGAFRYRLRHADGHWVWVEGDFRNHLANPAVEGFVVALRDITDQVVGERTSALVMDLADLAREDLDDEAYRARVLETFCRSLDWDYGEYWRLDHDRNLLVYDSAWYEPTPERDQFHAGSLDLTFSPGEGLPGRAWQRGRRVWSSDIARQGIMMRANEAEAAGLAAGLAAPFSVGGEFDGCFVFFDREAGDEDFWRIRVVEETLARIEPVFAARDSRVAVTRSEERFRALTEYSSDVVVILDRNLVRTYVSPSSKEIIGYSPEELIGQRVGLSTSETMTLGQLETNFEELARTPGGELRWEQPFTMRDGRRLAIEVIAANHLDDPAIDGYVITVRDITSRKEAERLTARLAAIVTSTPTAIISVDRAGIIQTWNPGAEEMLGLSAAEVIGREALSLDPEAGLDGEKTLAAALGGQAVDLGRIRLPTPDGRKIDALVTVSPIVAANGEVTGASILARDVTELATAEREREETRARLQVVLDSTMEGFSLVSPDRDVLLMNRRLADWLNRPLEDLVGGRACVLDELFVQGVEQRRSMLGRAEDPDGVYVATLQTRETPPRNIACYSAPVHTADGVHLGRLSVYRDVTAESDAARTRDDMVAHMTHELRTPLTAIHAYSDMILEEGDTLEPGEQREFVEIIQSSADRLMRLVDNILEAARLESGEVDLAPEVVDAAATMRQITASLAPIFRDRDQSLLLDLPEHLPAVWAAPDRYEQILANLLSNASKYTLPGGTITISARRLDRALQISVSDTGVGMSPDELERLFTRFFRARNKATRAEKGTGLGLVITRNLVELQGGQLSVSSTAGAGSTFSFTLPLAPNPAVAARRRAPILVIEDTPEFARLTERRLTQEGYDVRIADSGELGLTLAPNLRPRLILLDLSLSGISGFAVLEQLKADPDLADIPVIVLSATPDPVATRQLGAADCLPKSIDEASFLERIQTVLGEQTGAGGAQQR